MLLNPFYSSEYVEQDDGQNFSVFTRLDQFNDDEEEGLGVFKRLNSKVGNDATKIEAFKGTLMTDFDEMSSKSSVSSMEDVR